MGCGGGGAIASPLAPKATGRVIGSWALGMFSKIWRDFSPSALPWVLLLSLILTNCRAFSLSFPFSEPQFPHLQNKA